jgi:uncharacterized phage protein (TIGR02218 family)
MRQLPLDLAAHLAGGATTLARCWTLIRRDGAVMGFTDHDRDIAVNGVTHQAGSALEPSDLTAEAGFGAGAADAAGALRAAGLTEADITAGLYDAARLELRLVNWQAPWLQQLLLDVFEIGEIRRGEQGFTVELRTLAHRFDEERGRVYGARCDADFGDARCNAFGLIANPGVTATDGRRTMTLSGMGAVPAGGFSGGRATFVSGQNAGLVTEIRTHSLIGGAGVIDLWIETPRPIAVGDALQMTQGCDKTFATCRDRYGNSMNFRGFPHMPGNSFLLQTAGEGVAQVFDGGSLFL